MKEDSPYDSNVVKQNLGNLLGKQTDPIESLKTTDLSLTTIKNDLGILFERLKKSLDEQYALLEKLDGGKIPQNTVTDLKKNGHGVLEDLQHYCFHISDLIEQQEKIATRLMKIIG